MCVYDESKKQRINEKHKINAIKIGFNPNKYCISYFFIEFLFNLTITNNLTKKNTKIYTIKISFQSFDICI